MPKYKQSFQSPAKFNRSCKYCKSPEHKIDNCPDVICLNCKKVGHPHWLCESSQDSHNLQDSRDTKSFGFSTSSNSRHNSRNNSRNNFTTSYDKSRNYDNHDNRDNRDNRDNYDNKKRKSQPKNRFSLLDDDDDSETELVTSSPTLVEDITLRDLDNLNILKCLEYSTTPWGDLH